MIKYLRGDLLDSKSDIIAHGCNCSNGFGSGVAKAVSIKYPKVKQAFHDKYEEDGWKLGDVQFVFTHDGKVVANCATQQAYLPRGINHADYDAIRKCMILVKDFAKASNKTIGIPKLGAGLAGGDWAIIEEILKDVFSDYDITIYVLGT